MGAVVIVVTKVADGAVLAVGHPWRPFSDKDISLTVVMTSS